MTRCQVCNRMIRPSDMSFNKKTKRWEFLCPNCRQIIYKTVFDNNNSPQDEQQEEQEAQLDEQ